MTTDPFSKDEGKHSPDQEAPEPELQPETLRLKDQLSVERWERVVERALERVEVLEATAKRREKHGESWRRRPDAQKRQGRPLSTLALVNSRPEVMAQKLLAMGLTPLLTEKRGFDGLRGPNGDWLGVLRGTAYVDATQDPFWTRLFARSGKVSRVGRVMPCITRVALMGGAGVPLWVETRAGTVSLKKEFLSTLDRIEQGAKRLQTGEWQRYRERDLVRETRVLLHGEGAPEGGLELRGVEMQRDGSRNPTTTLFTTNAPPGELGTADVPTAYLSRGPHQEQRFREGRHGLGMDRSHGYGGECVTHVAVATQQDQALKRTERAQADIAAVQAAMHRAQALLEVVSSKEHREAAADNLRRSSRDLRRADKRLREAQQEVQHLATTPREIYARDMTRDGIVTCLKMTILMLIEYVLKEYFGGVRMEVRTFIEDYVRLAVTVRTTATEGLFQIAANPRAPEKTRGLEAACAEATRRDIRMGDRVLRFAVVSPPPEAGSARPEVGSSPLIF